MSWTGRAQVLTDTSELAQQAEWMAGRCRGTGLDPRSFTGVIGAAIALGAYPVSAIGPRYTNDRELITAICDLLDDIADKWQAYVKLRHQVATARARARVVLRGTTNERDVPVLQGIISDCTTALETLESLPGRLQGASKRLNETPEQLGETYAAVYALVAQGRRMPLNGRWMTGENPSC